MVTTSEIASACADVGAAFPFQNYITASTREEVRAVVRAIDASLPGIRGKRMLDIGCGPLDKTAVFQRLGLDCWAVDDLQDPWHAKPGVRDAIELFAQRVGVRFVRQTAGDYSIPFPEDSFDVVSALGVIEHLHTSPRDLLNTMAKFARPGGLVVLQTPNAANIRKRLSLLIGRSPFPDVELFFHSDGQWRGHVREFTLSELGYVCSEAGLSIERLEAFEAFAFDKLPEPLLSLFLAGSSLAPAWRSCLLVVARKPLNWSARSFDSSMASRAARRYVPGDVY